MSNKVKKFDDFVSEGVGSKEEWKKWWRKMIGKEELPPYEEYDINDPYGEENLDSKKEEKEQKKHNKTNKKKYARKW